MSSQLSDNQDWWSEVMFTYIYPDGDCTPHDYDMLNELAFIGHVLYSLRLYYCSNCDMWQSRDFPHWSCDF